MNRSVADERWMTALQTLTTGLAHEVRNPLNAAMLQLELLDRRLRREHDEPRLREPVATAMSELDRLARLLDDFTAFARPPALNLEAHDVAELVTAICDGARAAADARGLTLTCEAADGPLPARIDQVKVTKLLANLIANALDAATARVTVHASATVDELHFEVVDDGAGIAPDTATRIYEPFFTTKDSGTGLGMSIVHSLVDLHGGSIAFETSSRGTGFRVTLPRRIA